MMKINIVTIFPEVFSAPLSTSIPGRARDQGLVDYELVNLRDFTHDRHQTVDDYPYGGRRWRIGRLACRGNDRPVLDGGDPGIYGFYL